MFGKNCGLQTLLLLSGVTSWEDVEEWNKIAVESNDEKYKNLLADYYLPSLGDLIELIENSDMSWIFYVIVKIIYKLIYCYIFKFNKFHNC